MGNQSKSVLVFLCVVTLFFVIGCGYKPTTHYAKKEITGLVYTDIKINIDSANSSVLLKDAMNEMVLTQLGGTLTNIKHNADTLITLELDGVSHTPLTSDNEGYASGYRTSVSIGVKYQTKNGMIKRFNVDDYYDYSIASNATLSEQAKDDAIKNAVQRGLQELLSKLAVSSFKDQ